MAEEPTDWKVQVTLDRKALVEDLTQLAQILAKQRPSCIVSASSREEALTKAEVHLRLHGGIAKEYIKALNPRRLPT